MIRKLSMNELNRPSVGEFRRLDKFPYCLILNDIRSLNNVGSVFRTADAFRAESVWLCGITGTPPHRDITKTALGATDSVTWHYAPDAAELARRLRAEGWVVVAVEQAEGSVSLAEFRPEPDRPYAFVFGNEVTGVADAVLDVADLVVEIPQFGTKHSLNVAVSAGVVCWQMVYLLTN
jgi:23S rRNA (guanosine2251-2'-O)-methyltransferase